MNKELAGKNQQKSGMVKWIREKLDYYARIMTGVAASDRKELCLSLGHIIQGALRLELYERFLKELEILSKKGSIKDEDFQTKQGQACLMEMLNFLDEDNPDEIRFEFMKKLYIGIMCDDDRDKESPLEQQYISVCRKLTAGEIMTLVGAWKYTQGKKSNPYFPSDAWYAEIAKTSKLKHKNLAEYYGKMLEEKGLFDVTILVAGRERTIKGLTTLATEILKYIESYDENTDADSHE